MSQLIHMRKRIKAIETIKKITSAMRLVSRSLHTRMHKKKPHILLYQNEIQKLFFDLYASYPQWKQQKTAALFFSRKSGKKLYIIVGAQKGLCGTYNSKLIYWLRTYQQKLSGKDVKIIVIGNKIMPALKKCKITPIKIFDELTQPSRHTITQKLMAHLLQENPFYSNVTIVSNYAQTFFAHRHKETVLIPLVEKNITENNENDCLWQNDPGAILEKAAYMYLETTIDTLLFEALSGEQAARFIAMDNATRNAEKFLEEMQLQYNKLRQAKITKELMELATSFQN